MPRVLIIDDYPASRETLAGILRLHGFEAATAETGREGIARGVAEPFDGILVDFHLPDIPGTEVVRELKARGVSAPMVILTAFPDPDLADDPPDVGAAGYIDAPLFDDDVVQIVGQALSGRSPVRHPSDIAAGAADLPTESSPMAVDARVRQAVKLSDSSLAEHLSIRTLAGRFRLSESRFRHRFTALIGLPFSAFRTERRLRRIAHLLVTTSEPFETIAMRVGLGYDVRRARRRFRTRFGLSPGAYRTRFERPPGGDHTS